MSFKSGDIIECIRNDGVPERLTIGGKYRITHVTGNSLSITCDKGIATFFNDDRFRNLMSTFKKGDLAKCIDPTGYEGYLTSGKVYTVNDMNGPNEIKVTHDKGNTFSFAASRFTLVADSKTAVVPFLSVGEFILIYKTKDMNQVRSYTTERARTRDMEQIAEKEGTKVDFYTATVENHYRAKWCIEEVIPFVVEPVKPEVEF